MALVLLFGQNLGAQFFIYAGVLLAGIAFAFGAYLIRKRKERSSLKEGASFTRQDFLAAAERAWKEGAISRQEREIVTEALSDRWRVISETKVVSAGKDVFDYYLDDRLWGAVEVLGAKASGEIVSRIPGLKDSVKEGFSAVTDALQGVNLEAKNGVVIRVRQVSSGGAEGMSECTYRFVSIGEQEIK